MSIITQGMNAEEDDSKFKENQVISTKQQDQDEKVSTSLLWHLQRYQRSNIHIRKHMSSPHMSNFFSSYFCNFSWYKTQFTLFNSGLDILNKTEDIFDKGTLKQGWIISTSLKKAITKYR